MNGMDGMDIVEWNGRWNGWTNGIMDGMEEGRNGIVVDGMEGWKECNSSSS
jgi:hypothetical protein